MSVENTSTLTFNDLILEVAYKIGVANYGTDGLQEPEIPTDTHDLILCKRIVNKAIRMFIHDGPTPNGWQWLNPVAQVDLWPQIDPDTSLATKITGTFANGITTITLIQPVGGTFQFLQSMEMRTIWIGGMPPAGTSGFNVPPGVTYPIGTPFTVVSWISPTQMTLQGDATATIGAGNDFSFASTGDYTLPANFGGQYTGEITYVAQTNRGMILHWTSEAVIRARRQNFNVEQGTPYEAAVRIMPTPSLSPTYTQPRRRWELLTWRISSEFLSVLFPYTIHFDNLVNLTDYQPAPFPHDETVKAACLAVAEKETGDTTQGPDWSYYQHCLQNSYRIDALSRPKRLGYFGNPSAANSKYPAIRDFRAEWEQRPTVPVNGLS